MTARGSRSDRRPVHRTIADHLLTVLAAAGTVCIILVILSWVFNISIIMFRTGSMSPTITAGSIAFVQEIPAAEMAEGDVVTVDRGEGVLPVTHRVVDISEADPASGAVTFEMRGDANDAQDPEPYTATEVRRVMFSVPGAARIIQWFGNPLVLGGITVAASLLVVWAFWPRAPEGHSGDDMSEHVDPRAEDVSTRYAVVPLAAVLVIAAGGLQPSERSLITGEHLRLQTDGDASQMQNLAPGEPVDWDVGVWADAPEPGQIRLGISGSGDLAEIAGALTVSVRACTTQWAGAHCPAHTIELMSGESLTSIAAADGSRFLTTMPADQERWLKVTVVLNEQAAGAELSGAAGSILIHAEGAGEELSVGPDPDADGPPDGRSEDEADGAGGGQPESEGPLARTGARGVMLMLLVGATLLSAGTAVTVARRRRQSS